MTVGLLPRAGRQGTGASRRLRAFLVAYCVIAPAVFVIPEQRWELPAAFRAFVRAAENSLPMIERVLAYGHPAPEKAGAFLAWTWLCVPLLLAVLWRAHETDTRPLAWGTDARSIVKRYLVVMTIFLGILLYIAYWPSHSLDRGWITGPLGSINDARLRLFRSDGGLGLSAPIWATVVASTLDAICVETRALVFRLRNNADAADDANAKG